MIKSATLSRFTPSLLAPETLEAIFVRREKLAARLVELVRESALTDNKHYVLLVGPRGIGKTHLVSLVYHRVQQDAALDQRLRIAWLREEEWGITSYLDLLLAILRALGEQHRDSELAQSSEAIVGLPAEQAEVEAERLIRDYVAGTTALLIVENLDDVFRGLAEDGQRKLRAFIQNRPVFAILATSPSLFGGVSVRTSAFYGFFEVHHLDELSFDDAVSLLVKIAEHEGDKELAARLAEPAGRARVRALHHLAGGNPRVYVIFSQFLTCESLDQLTDAVLRTLDDLTPYYQARMNYLSPQQRKIVSFLCDRRGAVPVGEIAEGNFLTHQGASSQLKKLREFGYVRSHQLGRESYYELREPLMRLAMEVKKTRGGPVRLLVDFLQLWYTEDELIEELARARTEIDKRLLGEAMLPCKGKVVDPRVDACNRDFSELIEAGDWTHALEVAEELATLNPPLGWSAQADCFRALGQHRQALEALKRVAESHASPIVILSAHINSSSSLLALLRIQEALASLNAALQIASQCDVPTELNDALCNLRDRLASIVEVSEELLSATLRVTDSANLEKKLKGAMRRCQKDGQLTDLGGFLVQGIPALFDPAVTTRTLEQWLAAWENACEGRDQLALPLRLLRAAVEYRETRDKRVLLRLPAEEREILQSLLPE